MGIKEKLEEVKHIGGLVAKDNWDFALAAGGWFYGCFLWVVKIERLK